MSLTIETNNDSKTPSFVADETPTPTRFIRNCEEVGLFQDLNVNPFDEQFRRAAQVITVLTPPSAPSIDDVLHTPHVFPVTSEPETTSQLPPPKSANVRKHCLIPSLSTSECLTLPSPLSTPLITITAPSESHTSSNLNNLVDLTTAPQVPDTSNKISDNPANIPGTKKEKTKKSNSQNTCAKAPVGSTSAVNILPRPVLPLSPSITDPLTALLVRLPDGRLVQIPTIPVSTETGDPARTLTDAALSQVCTDSTNKTKPHSTIPVLSEAKLKLKQVLAKTQAVRNSSANVVSPSVTSDASGTDTELVADHNNPGSRMKRKRGYNPTSDPDLEEDESEKRQKFLERNRAAAFRSRQKRKRWVSNLEARTNAITAANRMLQNEVLSLRTEVAQLKLQLLAHKDCPVTLALCQYSTLPKDDTTSLNTEVRFPASTSVPNPTIQTNTSPRQIIILNTSSPTSTSVPLVGNKITHTPIVLQPTLTAVSRTDTDVSYSSNVMTLSNHTDSTYQTSVITSTKPSLS